MLKTLFVKIVIALTFLLVGCAGTVTPETSQSACFEAGQHLGMCTDPKALWVGCDAAPPASNCKSTGFDGQWCCDPEPVAIAPHTLGRQCSIAEGAGICDPDHYLEACEYPHTQPQGCIAPIGSALQDGSKYWCCQ